MLAGLWARASRLGGFTRPFSGRRRVPQRYYNDAQLGRINLFYHEASGGKYVPRAVLMDLELA
jgi:hypothetical protein